MQKIINIESLVENIANEYIKRLSCDFPLLGIGISNRHVHLSKKDINVLFGVDYELAPMKELSQTGQYVAKEVVTLKGSKGEISDVRVLGPAREQSQVEILMSDTYKLGIRAPVRYSGDLNNTPGILLSSPKGEVRINEGVIVAKRHIHINTQQADVYGLKDRDEVNVSVKGGRGLEFKNVLVRVHESFCAEFHIDMDEANAADLISGDLVEIYRQFWRR